MHPNPILTFRLAQTIVDERVAEAAHERRLNLARTGRRPNRWAPAFRRTAGDLLIRLGARLIRTGPRTESVRSATHLGSH